MIRDATLLLAWIATAALWGVVHVLLLIRAARAEGLPTWARVLAWVPPLTPVVGWRAGARVAAVTWAATGVFYGVLRGLE